MIATSASGRDDFAFEIRNDEPFLGILLEPLTRSKIEFVREEDGSVEVTFRSQGERLCVYTRRDGAGSLQVYKPTDRLDLQVFFKQMADFYDDLPELLEFVKEGFDMKALEKAADPVDRFILSTVLGRVES